MEVIEIMDVEIEPKQQKPSLDWKAELAKNGYVVIPNVLDHEKAIVYYDRFWDWLEEFNTGIDRDDSQTWKGDNWPSNSHGIFQNYGIGHAQFVWDMRTEPNVIQVFKDLWKTEKLLTSFDGANMSKPSNRSGAWAHVDQGPKKVGFQCAQGFVSLSDCGDDDGGLVVYERSHLLHEKFFKVHERKVTKDWYKFDTDSDELRFYQSCKQIKVNCKAGDMVLWDSRTVHYNKTPSLKSKCRSVIYVCMTPKKLATKNDLEKKVSAFKYGRMTSHWPHKPILFPINPNTRGNKALVDNFQVSRKELIVNTTMLQLAGVKKYA